MIVNTDLSFNGSVNVMFTAAGLKFNRGSVIVDMRMLDEKTQQAVCESYPIYASVKNKNLADKGTLFPGKILDISMKPRVDRIIAPVELWHCNNKEITITIPPSSISEAHYVLLREIADNVKYELDTRMTMVQETPSLKKSFAFFESLLYSYSDTIDEDSWTEVKVGNNIWYGPTPITKGAAKDMIMYPSKKQTSGVEFIDVLEAVNDLANGTPINLSGHYSRSLGVMRSIPVLVALDSRPESGRKVLFGVNDGINIIAEVLYSSYTFLAGIRELATKYNSPEAIQSNRKIWSEMGKFQIQK
jgi:hypothetical protein